MSASAELLEGYLSDVIKVLEKDSRNMCRLTCIAHFRLKDFDQAWEAINAGAARAVAVEFNAAKPDDKLCAQRVHRNVIIKARDLTEAWLEENPDE